MSVPYSIVSAENDGESMVVIIDGLPHTVDSSHVNYSLIRNLVELEDTTEAEVLTLIDVTRAVATSMEQITDRVSVRGRTLYFDEEPIPGALADHIVRLVGDGDTAGYQSLAHFLEKVMDNPGGASSRDALWSWINERDITITLSGDFIAYKGVARTHPDSHAETEGTYYSIHSGEAIVNDVAVKGYIPNKVGDVITMPRHKVDNNGKNGCSHGLHAGTWRYAYGFARGAVLAVQIDPRDVVSVPHDSSYQKLRVCKYKVQSVVEKQYEVATWKD